MCTCTHVCVHASMLSNEKKTLFIRFLDPKNPILDTKNIKIRPWGATRGFVSFLALCAPLPVLVLNHIYHESLKMNALELFDF